MSKTAREVIAETPQGAGDMRHYVGWRTTDEIIAALTAAGFVIVPKLANTCSSCKHYHPHDSNGLGQCHRWHGGDGFGGYDGDTVVAPNEVIVETDEGWGAFIGSEFGCVLWEPKP